MSKNSDKRSEFFGRTDRNGNVAVLHRSGEAATRLDFSIYAVDGQSVRYEHPEGVVIGRADAEKIGLEVES